MPVTPALATLGANGYTINPNSVFTPASSLTLRQVASNARIADSFNGTNKQSMGRSAHFMRAPNVSSLQLVYEGWYAAFSTGEVGVGPVTITASIEYPSGTFTRVTFGGSNTGSIANLGELISDQVAINIPINAQFWVRTWYSSPTGIIYRFAPDGAFGEAFQFGVTTADLTMGGTITPSGNGPMAPVGIIGYSSKSAIAFVGDSRTEGQNDTYGGATNDLGNCARSLGPLVPTFTSAIPSESAFLASTNYTRRASLINRFCTHVLCSLGVNDVNLQARTAAQAIVDLATIWGLFPTLPVLQTTIGPVSTSTDAFITTVNQTTAAGNAQRVLLNNAIRQSVAVAGVIELADVTESARDSGLWKAPVSGVAITTDGLHESQKACALIVSSGVLHPGRFLSA